MVALEETFMEQFMLEVEVEPVDIVVAQTAVQVVVEEELVLEDQLVDQQQVLMD
jgi:hypothetical protein